LISTNPVAGGPLLLGHRGARKYAPENTLEAFELALEHGCDGFEFDVRATGDRRLAIWHDATLRGMRLARADYKSLCDRLQTRWRINKAAHDQAVTIPCLEEVLAAFGERAYLNIEIKDLGIEKEVAAAIAASPPRRGYLASSFHVEVVQQLRAINPELSVGWIVSDRRLLANWRTLKIDALVAHHSLVSAGLVEAVHAAGRKFVVWTVNRPKKMLRLAYWGVDAIISDDTKLLSKTLR
jgi:glycerophosphoryl diester phosphodiesterase